MTFIDHIEDDPADPQMVTAYVAYGTPQQIAYRMERASILELSPPSLWPNTFTAWKPVCPCRPDECLNAGGLGCHFGTAPA